MSRSQFFAALTLLHIAARVALAQAPCSPWTVTSVPVPTTWSMSVFNDVSALQANDAWAVGRYSIASASGATDTYTLAMHWDGTAWTQSTSISPVGTPGPGGTYAEFNAVAAIAPNDLWAAGEATGLGGLGFPGPWIMIQHFDGTSWTLVPGPAPVVGSAFNGTRVTAILAFASNDVWFCGQWGQPNAIGNTDFRPLALHWDGQSLTNVPTPVVWPTNGQNVDGFRGVSMSALAPNDIYMVCRRNNSTGAAIDNVVLHWNGSTWTRVTIPTTSPLHAFREVVAVASNDIWLFGTNQSNFLPHVLHYDGVSWTQIAGGPNAACAVADGPSQIYYGTDTIGVFNGATTSTVTTFPGVSQPSIVGMSRFAPCGIFGVGRDVQNGVIRAMAAFTAPPGISPTATTRPPCVYPAPPQSLVAQTLPRVGQPFSVAAGDPTNAASLTPFSTFAYLIISAAPSQLGNCGLPLPGFGIGSATGELLVDVGAASIAVLGPTPWGGPSLPAVFSGSVPNLPSLAGFAVFEQAALIDLSGPSAPGVLTEGLDLVIGS